MGSLWQSRFMHVDGEVVHQPPLCAVHSPALAHADCRALFMATERSKAVLCPGKCMQALSVNTSREVVDFLCGVWTAADTHPPLSPALQPSP